MTTQRNNAAVSAWRHARRALPYGAKTELAALLGVSRAAVGQWRQVPEAHLEAVARFLKLRPIDLRPDIDPWSKI